MKKSILSLVLGLAVAPLFAENSLESIQWRVSDAVLKGAPAESLYFAYAMVAVRGTSGVYLKASNGSGYDDAIDAVPDTRSTDAVYSLVPSEYGLGDSFFVELYDDNDKLLGFSDAMSYADLRTMDAVYVPGINGSGAAVWSVSQFNNVPEPTSGLLLLLGCAGLALRRKRA